MILLGIDIGLSKTGVARADGPLATPYTVIHEKDVDRLTAELSDLVAKENVEKVIVGIPEGELVTQVNEVGDKLKNLGIDVEFHDETLSTQDAQRMAIEAGVPQQKRRELEDAFSAAVMLQSFIDGH